MLELVAAWTTLSIRWDVRLEWASRRQAGLEEHFYETAPARHLEMRDDHACVKVLDPQAPIAPPVRAILMIRDPRRVSRSAAKIGQRITPEQVSERMEAFRMAYPAVDEVYMGELNHPTALFARLAAAGWPVVAPSYEMETRAVR